MNKGELYMKVAFRKTHDYCCCFCDKQFNWDTRSCRYGKEEYSSDAEIREVDRVFCSKQCFDLYFKKP